MITSEEIRQKLLDLPELFMVHYKKKEYAQAKYCYDTARNVSLFIELEEKDMLLLFGNRQDEEHPVEGLFNEEQVQRCYQECIKANQTYEKKPYPGRPGKRKTA